MNKCPECGEYSLDYDVFEKRAICTHNSCGFKKPIDEADYIIKYSNVSKYAVIPKGIEEKIKRKGNNNY